MDAGPRLRQAGADAQVVATIGFDLVVSRSQKVGTARPRGPDADRTGGGRQAGGDGEGKRWTGEDARVNREWPE